MINRAFLATTLCLAASGAIAAPTWTSSELSPALGLLAIQCDQRDFCFAIACPDKKLQLVNISPGGGPYGDSDPNAATNAVSLTVGGEVFKLSFVWDDSIIALAGDAGSRSALPVAALMALAEQNGKTEGTTSGPVKANIFKSGLKLLLPSIAKACALPELQER
jgi:hypothetical protein